MYAKGGISPPMGVDITPLGGGYHPHRGGYHPQCGYPFSSGPTNPTPTPHLKVLPPHVMRLIFEVGHDPDNGHQHHHHSHHGRNIIVVNLLK